MKFFSRNHRPVTRVAPIGDGTVPIYEEVLDEGQPALSITGRENLFDFVQASKEESMVYNIISRYQRGDVTALAQRVGKYVDVTGMPTNLMDAYAVMRDAQAHFDSLSSDVRAQFNDDFNVYLEKISQADAAQLASYFAPTVNNTESAVEKDGDVNA